MTQVVGWQRHAPALSEVLSSLRGSTTHIQSKKSSYVPVGGAKQSQVAAHQEAATVSWSAHACMPLYNGESQRCSYGAAEIPVATALLYYPAPLYSFWRGLLRNEPCVVGTGG
jgi:hypothetical protein